MGLVGGSCRGGGLGETSLEGGCWSVVRHPAKVDIMQSSGGEFSFIVFSAGFCITGKKVICYQL